MENNVVRTGKYDVRFDLINQVVENRVAGRQFDFEFHVCGLEQAHTRRPEFIDVGGFVSGNSLTGGAQVWFSAVQGEEVGARR